MTTTQTDGAPCWIELSTPDAERSVAFYGDLFGWTAGESSAEFGGYFMFFHDEQPVAGCMPHDRDSGDPAAWAVYLHTSDVEATVKKVAAAGGQVVVEPMQVGDLGHMASVVDPAGAGVGAWQPIGFQGFAVRGEVGAPAWFETLSTDYAGVVAFYREAFDWDVRTMSDTPEFRYSTLGEGAEATAGIMDATAFLKGAPSCWQFYVQVEDTDATVAQALRAGGREVNPAEDSPYGRPALLEDPTGVRFAVMGPVRGR